MRSLMLCSVLFLISTLNASSAFAATLDVVDGQLMGASNVLVDGNLYDVQFLGGTCIALYNGCDAVSDFTFQTSAAAGLASQALLDQVFIDGGGGSFDTDPALTNGCTNALHCAVATPYQLQSFNTVAVISTAQNNAIPGDADFTDTGIAVPRVLLATVLPTESFAAWTPVPEPSTAFLLDLGLTGLAGKGRRRNRS